MGKRCGGAEARLPPAADTLRADLADARLRAEIEPWSASQLSFTRRTRASHFERSGSRVRFPAAATTTPPGDTTTAPTGTSPRIPAARASARAASMWLMKVMAVRRSPPILPQVPLAWRGHNR